MDFTADGFDVSGLGQPGFDWVSARVCITGKFGSARISHGPYTDRDGVVHPAFIDSSAAGNREGMLAVGIARRCWYVIVTPLEDAATAAARVQRWVGLNGGLPAGECIALDWEDNPQNPGEVASIDLVLELWTALAAVYGAERVGFYASRGYLVQLPDWRGFRWLASYTTDAREQAAKFQACVVQWTSSFMCDPWPKGLDTNEVTDQGALDRACGIPEVVVGAPAGSLDVAEPEIVDGHPTGRLHVSGWAYDPDQPDVSIQAHVYVGGQLAAVVNADKPREDVNAQLGITGGHGYDEVVPILAAVVQVQVYGINVGAGDNALIGSKDTTVDLSALTPPPPQPVPVPPEPQPEPPVPPTEDVEAIARRVARDEISRTTLNPGV